MANPQRGEVELTLGGNVFVLRPSFEAIVAIEQRTGKDLFPLARKFMDSRFGLGEACVVIDECIKAAGGEPPKQLGEMIRAEGLVNLVKPLVLVLTYAIAGDAKGNDSAGEAKTVA